MRSLTDGCPPPDATHPPPASPVRRSAFRAAPGQIQSAHFALEARHLTSPPSSDHHRINDDRPPSTSQANHGRLMDRPVTRLMRKATATGGRTPTDASLPMRSAQLLDPFAAAVRLLPQRPLTDGTKDRVPTGRPIRRLIVLGPRLAPKASLHASATCSQL